MVYIFGIFTRRGAPVEPIIVSSTKLQDGSARIGDLVEVAGGCPRFPGDACDLVGGYKSVVIDFHGELYYRIISSAADRPMTGPTDPEERRIWKNAMYMEHYGISGAKLAEYLATHGATPMDIPRDKTYPADAVQCDPCGGIGITMQVHDDEVPCEICAGRGWLPAGHTSGRLCARAECGKPLAPNHVAVYCTNQCAFDDA